MTQSTSSGRDYSNMIIFSFVAAAFIEIVVDKRGNLVLFTIYLLIGFYMHPCGSW